MHSEMDFFSIWERIDISFQQIFKPTKLAALCAREC